MYFSIWRRESLKQNENISTNIWTDWSAWWRLFTTNNIFHSAELETNILLMRTIGVCDVTAGYKVPLAITTPKYLRNIWNSGKGAKLEEKRPKSWRKGQNQCKHCLPPVPWHKDIDDRLLRILYTCHTYTGFDWNQFSSP